MKVILANAFLFKLHPLKFFSLQMKDFAVNNNDLQKDIEKISLWSQL